VAFEVIPAIDVAADRLVRMSADGAEPVAAFGGDPVAAAAAYVGAGAGRLHVVDVELARDGRIHIEDVLRAVAALGRPVQASGGVRSRAAVEALLEAGAERVVVGSAALGERDRVEGLLEAFGTRLCLGIEADGPTIRPRGGAGELPLWETLAWLGELEVPRYVFTEVRRVGALAGPDLDGIWALATHTGRPVVAAGGVRSLEDLRALAGLGGGVEGAVVGRALHEGLDLRAAIDAVA
jgi:phosphoribosylformimino-5-aminoimidazole carboxamide ribonucleotide (ProFAR) isomerase